MAQQRNNIFRDLQTRIQAILLGLEQGTQDQIRGKLEVATIEFLDGMFSQIIKIITAVKIDSAQYNFSDNVFGFKRTKPLTKKWINSKTGGLRAEQGARNPMLWRIPTQNKKRFRQKHRDPLEEILQDLSTKKVGKQLYDKFGGISGGATSGKSTFRENRRRGMNGRPYNTVTQKYESWATAVRPEVVNAVKNADIQLMSGAKRTASGRITLPTSGRGRSVSIYSAIQLGYAATKNKLIFLERLNAIQGPSSATDEIALMLKNMGELDGTNFKKFDGLHKQGHPILTSMIGMLMSKSFRGGDSNIHEHLDKVL